LALEGKTAILQLPLLEQDHMRHQVAINLRKLYAHYSRQYHYNSIHDIQEKKTLNKIKEKLNTNNATIIKADKGHSIVIMPITLYYEKVQNFIQTNEFHHIDKDLTTKFQNDV
jgi:hypothetical protein